MVLAGIAVADLAQTDLAGHVLQLAITIGGAGQAVERMVGDVELHHPAADLLEPLGLGRHDHAGRDRSGAGGGRAGPAGDLDEAQPAGSEGGDRVRRAQFRHLDPGVHRGAHDRGAFRHRDRLAVDRERDRPGGGLDRRRAEIDLVNQRHEASPYSAATGTIRPRKSSGKWRTALITGYGVKPPKAQSDPNFKVLHRSSSSARLDPTRSPFRIRSITSTPRVEPMRQGVHLPQDSMAQNSIAKRACRAMSTVSSKITTPPWPISPSFCAKA